MKKFLLIPIWAMLLCPTALTAQESPSPSQSADQSADQTPGPVSSEVEQTVVDRLTDQIRRFPQEKIYIHTDKPYYSAGDTLWFKAYLVHATLHAPMHYSRYIYTEIINDRDQVVCREKVRPENDMYYCQIPLKAEFVPGHYKIRAYTHYMRNLPEDYFFSREFYIGNAIKSESDADEAREEHLSRPKTRREEKRKTEHDASFAVQFFPEGGHLIAGATQNIAFKALADDGLSCEVHGRILDDEDHEITALSSTWLGMGAVGIVAESGRRYRAVCENEMGEEYVTELPVATDSTYSLSAKLRNEVLRASVISPGNEPLRETLHLLVALRGLPLWTAAFPSDDPQIALPTGSLPGGVLQVMLYNDRYEVLAERLVFHHAPQHPAVAVDFDKPAYGRRERVNATIRVTDAQGNPLKGDFSLTVTDDRYIRLDSTASDIESYLLLESDLRGNIEQPGAYFHPADRKAETRLDLLMLTQGWRRYDLPSVMKGQPQALDKYELEVGATLCGRLQTYPIRRAVPNANISIFNSSNGYADAVSTDNSGRFCFQGFEFADSTTFFVQAAKKEGQILELSVKAPDYPDVSLPVILPREDIMDQTMLQFLNKSRERYYYENGSIIINLEAAVVTAKAVNKVREDRGAMYMDPSYSFDEAALEDMAGLTILDILLQAPGVTLNSSGDGVQIRGGTPAVYVDNMPMSMSDLSTISVFDVELIDILKDPTQTMLYQGGSNGVIVIYLKRGQRNQEVELGSHQKRVGYMGYTSPKEFYQPIYSVEKNRLNPTPDLRNTIYWKPDNRLDTEGSALVRFYTSDEKTTYTLTVEGLGANGEIIRASRTIKRQ